MKPGVKLTAFVFLVSCIIAIAFCINKGPQSYFGILKHDQAYYAQIAESCSNLLAQTNYFSKEYTIKGDDPSLAAPLLKLHATTINVADRVLVGTNYESGVSLIFGPGRPYYVISWYQNDYGKGNRPWELAVNGDGPHTVVFSTDSSSKTPFATP